jgi:hypothetical protein
MRFPSRREKSSAESSIRIFSPFRLTSKILEQAVNWKKNQCRSMPEQFSSVLTRAVVEQNAQCDGAPRIYGPFPARVRGRDARGQQFESEAAVDDLSAADFNLRLRQQMEQGARLFTVARLHKALVAMRGIVLKAEPTADGLLWSLSIRIVHNRFLS